MNCCECQGIDDLFNERLVMSELAEYRAKGPIKTTRMLINALQQVAEQSAGVQGLDLLDIGGGIGAIQLGLLAAGARQATDVDASRVYLRVAREEASRRGFAERVRYQYGNFVDVADAVPAADIVTLDRVLCCFPNMEALVQRSAERAKRLYGLVYPRDTRFARMVLPLLNGAYRLRRIRYRFFIHPTQTVEAIVQRLGFQRRFYAQTFIWQVVVYER